MIFLFPGSNIVIEKANKVAHELARLARFSSTIDWFEEPMNEIVPFLTNDVSVISIE